MRRLLLLVCLLVLFSGERAFAQRTGPGLFLGSGPCSDVTGQVTNQSYCMDYSTGALYVWDGAKWAPISGNGVGSYAGPTALSIANTSAATGNTQAYFQAQSNAGYLFMGVRGTGYNLTDVPAGYGFVETSAGTNGLYLNSDGGGIYFAANNNLPVGSMLLAEDTSGDFSWYPPGGGNFYVSGTRNGSLDIIVDNISSGSVAQGGLFVSNSAGIAGGFSALGTSWAPGGPYLPSEAYVNGDQGNGLLLYSAAVLHLGSSSQPFTLDMTSDGSGDFNFASNATASNQGIITFQTNSVVRALSENNVNTDIFQVLAQNLTQGVSIGWNYVHEIGSCGACALSIDAQPGAPLYLNDLNPTGYVGSYSQIYTFNNHHINTQLNSATPPNSPNCPNGYIAGGSTDVAGQLLFAATGGVTNCLLNFGSTWSAAPRCVCSAEQQIGGISISCGTNTSTTQLQLTFQGSFLANNGQVNWVCVGN